MSRWAWLPREMPTVARMLADHRQVDGASHVDECWRRGMAGEPGWFFAREGPLAIGTPWSLDDPAMVSVLELQRELNPQGAILLMRPPGVDATSGAAVPIADKVRHAMAAGQTRDHACHWPGCQVQVPPARWGCREHWYTLPKDLRERIWRAYEPGQEVSGRPSAAYLAVATAVQAWIADKRRV